MTAVQLNAEIYRAMGVIAEDENLLARAAKYLKKLAAKKEDPTLMTKEEFFARVEEAEKQIAEGKGIKMMPDETLDELLNNCQGGRCSSAVPLGIERKTAPSGEEGAVSEGWRCRQAGREVPFRRV